MLSVASVGSAGGAAQYFAKDDYYLGDGPGELSEWGGKGAEALGLSGDVKKDEFHNVLDGKAPDGTVINGNENRQKGTDLTFSAPKSVSILSLVTGDKRLEQAQTAAVRATLADAEKKFAETRDYSRNSKGEPVRTGNLVYALFQHDTSRKLDPQLHTHAVIAAITQAPSGKWQALHNRELWSNNSLLGATYHAYLRNEIEKLGYETEITGKHGQFEIKGVPKEILQSFSQRRQEILEKAEEIGVSTPQGQDKVVVNTRDAKLNVEDKEALRSEWQARAAQKGFDGKALVEQSKARSTSAREESIGSTFTLQKILNSIKQTIGSYTQPADPLTTHGIKRVLLTPTALRTEHAVASAIRILGQREAAFDMGEVGRTALNLGLKGVTADKVDARIATLLEKGALVPGTSDRVDQAITHITTPEHIAQERQLLREIDRGRGASTPIVPASEVTERLQKAAGERPLNGEQLGAATLALSTTDRIAVVQGVAGAGKTTMIDAMARVASEEGKEILGLAFANKMVAMLKEETGIEAQTVSSFVNAHIRGAKAGSGPNYEESRAALAGKVLVLDEASLVANEQLNNLTQIANTLGADRLVMIGDRSQLQPIDAGKAFSLVQSHDPAMARLDVSQRQKTDHMKQVATLTREGKYKEAFELLGKRVVAAGKDGDHVEIAADKWLGLSPEDRERTALYASGRAARMQLNEIVQSGLKHEGVLQGEGRAVTTLAQINATREELRYPQTYRKGQVLNVVRNSLPAGLERGRYEVAGKDARGRIILLDESGRRVLFNPSKIDPTDRRDAIQLSEKDQIKLHEGDKIRWSANDKDRGLLNSEEAKVLSADEHRIQVQNARGEILDLKNGDKMLERLGLSYAINMHQAQGMTTDKGIGVMHSSERHLSNQRLTHVMVTRVREDIEIVTNDKDQLLRSIERNRGDKASALEVIGEKDVDRHTERREGKTFNPTIPDHLKPSPEERAAMQAHHSQSMRPVPQLDLPERNIERSR